MSFQAVTGQRVINRPSKTNSFLVPFVFVHFILICRTYFIFQNFYITVDHQGEDEDDDELVSSSVEKAASKAKADRQTSAKKSRDTDTGKRSRTTSRRRQVTSTDEDDDDDDDGADEVDELYDLSKDPNAVPDDDDDLDDDDGSESDFEPAPKAKSKAKTKTSSSAKEKRKKPSAAATASAPATKKARLGPAVRKAIAMSKPTATATPKTPVGSSTLLNRGTTVGSSGSGGIRKQLGARLPIRSGLGRPSTTSKSLGASNGSTSARASGSGTPATPRMRSGLSKKAVVPRLHAYLPRK